MHSLRLLLLCAIGLLSLDPSTVAAQPSPDYRNDPFAIRLRAVVQKKYPHARIGIAGRHIEQFISYRLDLGNITPSEVLGRSLSATPATSEEIARAFLSNFSGELEINTDILELNSIRTFEYGKRGKTYDVSFRSCYRGIPVVRSTIDVEVGNERITVHGYNPVPIATIRIESPIPADSALASVEWSERKRFNSDAPRRPVHGYSIIDRVLFDDFFDIRDSTGRWIPFEERFIGCELVIFPQVVDEQVIPKYAWRICLGLGKVGWRDPYVEAIVDAIYGDLLDLNSLGGGCVVIPWARTSCPRK